MENDKGKIIDYDLLCRAIFRIMMNAGELYLVAQL